MATRIICSSLPKSASKTLVKLVGDRLGEVIFFEAKSFRGWGNLTPSTMKARAFRYSPVSSVLYGHFPYSYNFSKSVESADKVFIGIRPFRQIVYSIMRHVSDTSFTPLDFRLTGSPDGSLGWSRKSELERIDYLSRFIVAYGVRFVLSWEFARRLSDSVKFLTYDSILSLSTGKSYTDLGLELATLNSPTCGKFFRFRLGERGTNERQGRGSYLPTDECDDHLKRYMDSEINLYWKDFEDEFLLEYLFG